MTLYLPDRHEALQKKPWSLTKAKQIMTEIVELSQYETIRDDNVCIRTDAWCGDLGLALYLQDCIDQCDKFPMMEYF